MTDLRLAKQKLERLHTLCVPENEDDRRARLAREEAEAKRLASMSPLEVYVYRTTKEINELQQKQILYNDKMGSSSDWGTSREAVIMRNEMNKMKMALRGKGAKIPEARTEEEKRQSASLKKVLDRVKRADRAASGLRPGSARANSLYSDLDTPLTGDGAGRGSLNEDGPSNAKMNGVTEWDGNEDNFPGSSYEPVTLDQEFQQLMTVFRENDQEIDRLLDTIQHGVLALNQQAKLIHVELKQQDVLIGEAEKKMDNVTSQLVGVNKKLKKTINSINKDKMCLYIICLLILLALVGVILIVTKVIGK